MRIISNENSLPLTDIMPQKGSSGEKQKSMLQEFDGSHENDDNEGSVHIERARGKDIGEHNIQVSELKARQQKPEGSCGDSL